MPDWKIPENYSFSNNLTNEGWAWEYLRRNIDYQQDIQNLHQLIDELNNILECDVLELGERSLTMPKAWHFDPALFSRESIDDWKQRCNRDGIEQKRMTKWKWIAMRWGLKSILYSPNNDTHPEFLPYSPYPKLVNHHDETSNYYHGPDYGYQLIGTNVLIAFDVSLPRNQQIDEARRILEERSKELKVNSGRNYIDRGKRALYLRILDAYTAGASKEEIGLSDMYTFRNAGVENDYNRERTIRNHYRNAIEYCSSYREFLK